MTTNNTLILFIFLFAYVFAYGQQIPIQNYSIDVNGKVRLEVNSNEENYYLLQVKHHPDSAFEYTTSLTLGESVTTILTEPLRAYPPNHYRVLQYPINDPIDVDDDGLNDLEEFYNMPFLGPMNAAPSIPQEHALLSLNTTEAFQSISTHDNNTPWVEYLTDVEYAKFVIVDFYSSDPKIYFINNNTYQLHSEFTNYLGVEYLDPTLVKGQIIYHPLVLADNGTLGTYTFNFSNVEAQAFSIVQRTHELIALNMPYLKNNLAYFVTEANEQDYQENIALYQNSRIPVVFETDVYAGINYWGLNQTEGFGFFRLMSLGEVPDTRDIVLYESLPNSLPRVGGIITSFIQTPLSHVNLRAINDNIPNAFIRNPLDIDSITNLLGHYIYLETNQSSYKIREASLDEVNAWYENLRPIAEQIPLLNLADTSILPLDEIVFDMFDGYGAKTSNLATMRTFEFAEGTIPDGFGIPFYFYQEFMNYNGFFDEIEIMIQNTNFISDRNIRDAMLEQLRSEINSANMPPWMMNQLSDLQNAFPIGTSIRCRSSTNNEDLPEFSGAGLYDSKTHHPNEGHISKTIKEVFASLWNLRAFEEREFYRVNHFYTSMGILCHPNFEDEKVNGVGISSDPIYKTTNTFYLNSQLGEELITNPGSTYPEEILLNQLPNEDEAFLVIQYSSLVDEDVLLMTTDQLDLLRQYLGIIHDRFAVLYNAVNNTSFAMDIEFKIDNSDKLVIKQARPWVSFVPDKTSLPIFDNCSFMIYPNPASDLISVHCQNCGTTSITITNMKGELILEKSINLSNNLDWKIYIDHLSSGVYIVNGIMGNSICKSVKFIKR